LSNHLPWNQRKFLWLHKILPLSIMHPCNLERWLSGMRVRAGVRRLFHFHLQRAIAGLEKKMEPTISIQKLQNQISQHNVFSSTFLHHQKSNTEYSWKKIRSRSLPYALCCSHGMMRYHNLLCLAQGLLLRRCQRWHLWW
jgi:hypothetical protein